MRLYIIRHGITPWNKEKRFQGQKDIPLAKEGIQLAKEVGKELGKIPFDLIYTSPLKRAKQTALLVTQNKDIPMIEEPRIQEISFGDWEGESVLTSKKIPPEYLDSFYHNPLTCIRPDHGETFQDVCKRTEEFYQDLLQNDSLQDKTILISTHGAASRCLLCQFYEDKSDIWRGGVPANCSVTIVDVKNGISSIIEKDKLFSTNH